MTPAAGSQFGQIRLPRVGEEVAVVYPDGNIDHPLIIGALYNENHMPPWSLPKQQSLAGLRSRELGGGARGNHLVLDDTREMLQAQLKSDHQCSQLSLGHITRIEDNAGRKDGRGEGWELRTDGHGVARAAKGLLITTEARQGARGPIKDMGETVKRLDAAHKLQDAQAAAALHPSTEHKITITEPKAPEDPKQLLFMLQTHPENGRPLANVAYTLYKNGSSAGEGITDDLGRIAIKHTSGTPGYTVELANGEKFDLAAWEKFDPKDNALHSEQMLSNQGARSLDGSAQGRTHA